MDAPESGREGTLRVGGLTPLSTLDFPGELAAVVFCQGCPWRCRYCHNGELLPARGMEEIPWSEVLTFLERRRGLLDAIVFSGGEPTLQRALGKALEQVRALGYRIGLHTAGIYPERLAGLLPQLDWVGLDIKAPLASYAAITNVPGSGTAAWESARLLVASGVEHEIRITLHPTLLPPAAVQALVSDLESLGAYRILLQPCRTHRVLDPTLWTAMVDLKPYHDLLRQHPEIGVRS
jgi:pyruvate formate lyase activating enzyme